MMKLQPNHSRHGKVLVLVAASLPVMLGVVGFVVDGGFMASNQRRLQQAADAAATEAAMALLQGQSPAQAISIAESSIHDRNAFPTAEVLVSTPPTEGPYAGRAGHIHVRASLSSQTNFMQVLDGVLSRKVSATAVAASLDATDGAAVVVLEEEPPSMSIAGLDQMLAKWNLGLLVNQIGLSDALGGVGQLGLLNGITNSVVNLVSGLLNDVDSLVKLPPLPTLVAGLEVEGIGRFIVDGTIIVNTKWGGRDERGAVSGPTAGPPYALSCMPLLPTTLVRANDIRVVGGVDVPAFYQSTKTGQPSPLRANRLPVPDPLKKLPAPSTSVDAANVSAIPRGHVVRINVLSVGAILQPLLGVLWPVLGPILEPVLKPILETTPLTPGVYDSITVLSLGEFKFQPGVYVVRGKSPLTQISLSVIGGRITGNNVLFYVTDSAGYNAATGAPDAGEDPDAKSAPLIGSIFPSVLLVPILPGTSLSGLSGGSPLDGLLIYQRRTDRRPIIIAAPKLLGGDLAGTIYAKSGHLTLLGGQGVYNLQLVCGTLRIITLGDMTLRPQKLLAPAKDVFLVD